MAAREGNLAGSPRSPRRRLAGPTRGLFVLLLLAAIGVAAAALLRPGLEPKRAAANGLRTDDGAISLSDMQAPEDRPPGTTRSSDPAPRASGVIGVGTGEFSGGGAPPGVQDVDGVDPSQARVPSDAEIQAQLAGFRNYIDGMDPRKGGRAYIDKKGRAVLPKNAPRVVALVVAAANEIATKPYKWGGGHGAWKDSGYDCSGSVSFALAGARLLDSPLDSSGLMRFGSRGPGRWITIYSNPGHVYMTVAGLRFDTSGQGSAGTRWQRGSRPTSGYSVRHPPGL